MLSYPRCRPSSLTPLAMHPARRTKTHQSPFPRFCAYPAPSSPPCLCLTWLRHRSSTRTLPYPRAPGHRSSKSKRVRGKSRSDFASRRAHDATLNPGLPVLTRPTLRPRRPPCTARSRDARTPLVHVDLLSAAPLTLMRLTLLKDLRSSTVPRGPPARLPSGPPELRWRPARHRRSALHGRSLSQYPRR